MKNKYLIRGMLVLNVPLIVFLLLINFSFTLQFISISTKIIFIASLLFIILNTLFFYFILKGVALSVKTVEAEISTITNGKLNSNPRIKSNFLFNSKSIQNKLILLLESLTNILHTIDQISSGNFKNNSINQREKNILGAKLEVLKDILLKDKAVLEKNKKEEEQRNWISNGLAKFGDILRQDAQNIQQFGYSIISNLVDYVQFNQGAFYVINEEVNEDIYYELVAAVAYDRKKLLNAKIAVGEGLVGRCAFEKMTIYLKDIPNDYIKITSGLGTANPNNLLIIPCMLDNTVFGIIELASFRTIEKHEIEFIEKLGDSISSTISSLRNKQKTNALLKDSQDQSNELVAQEEELRQNLEEMETTQEDLKRQMELNLEMQKELTIEKFLFNILLENIPVRVNFKDVNRKYIRASKSFLLRFGKKSNDEIIGKTDFDFFDHEFAEQTMADELEIMNSGKARINFVEHEVKENGEEIWKNVSKIPLFDDNGNCVGIFASVYDITESKLLEKQLASEKQLFDILLENIPARINFKDADRRYIRASKSFLERFGKKSNDEIVGKTDFDFFDHDFAEQTMADELEIMNSGKSRINFVEHELNENGNEIWKNVTKIPMLDEMENCTGIFASVYDITDFKKAQLENKKLKDQILNIKK